jgi:hypothetical protein
MPRVARVDARPQHRLKMVPSSVSATIALAAALFLVGLSINVTFAMSYAPRSVWGAVLMAMVGASIEILALLSHEEFKRRIKT